MRKPANPAHGCQPRFTLPGNLSATLSKALKPGCAEIAQKCQRQVKVIGRNESGSGTLKLLRNACLPRRNERCLRLGQSDTEENSHGGYSSLNQSRLRGVVVWFFTGLLSTMRGLKRRS